jgi:flagellar biogenesis protein FliO
MLRRTEDVLHPASPILSSESTTIQVYFLMLLALILTAGWQIARLWLQWDKKPKPS